MFRILFKRSNKIESKFNIGDNVHVPKGERKVLGVKLDSKGILYLLESADGTREWVQEYWIEEEEKIVNREKL